MNRKNLKGTQDIPRVIILYDSLFGNTKKVAMSLNRGLESGGLYVDSNSIHEFDINELENYDIIGIGSPTHMRGISKPMKLFLSRIKHSKLSDKKGFIFETKASFPLSGSAAKKILRYFKMMKIELSYPVITGIVLGKEGPLEENTLAKMEEIGLDIADKMNKSI
ncbi:MAG: flavodoxin domain-containing protein [Candidatus Hodarchaeota archaeon]